MRIIHRINLTTTSAIKSETAALGIVLELHGGNELVNEGGVFEIDESDPRWPRVRDSLSRWDALDLVYTEFTQEELSRAAWLEMFATSFHGYPQPEDDYKEVTYDLSQYCEECGVGKVQKAPFQMRGEPRWGRRGILQMNWVFDVVFVQPAVWEEVFKPIDIGCRPVLHHRTQRELSTVVQLEIPISDVPLELTGYPCATCPECRRMKFGLTNRGYFPALRGVPTGHMVLTQEEFGVGGAVAPRSIMISQQVRQALIEHKIRGAKFAAVAEN